MSEFKQKSIEMTAADEQEKASIANSALELFLNLSKESHDKLIIAYNLVTGIQKAYEAGSEKEYIVLRDKVTELRDESFPHYSIEELSQVAVNYRTFILRGFNLNYAKHLSDVSELGPFDNSFKVEGNNGQQDYKFIKPIPIKSVSPDLTKADRMRRRHRSSALQSTDTLAVTLTNSFIFTRIRRPTKLEQAELINRIEKELKYYGERWAVSGLSLERAGISKILAEFFIELITYHSIEDIVTKEELFTLILFNDIDVIAMSLLDAGSPKGVYYNLTCLANACHYSSVRKYEASELYLTLRETFTEEQKAFLSALPIAGRKFKIEEIKALQNQYMRNGKPIDTAVKLYSQEDGGEAYGEFNLGIPTLQEYFETFELMTQIYNDPIQKYTLDYAADPNKLYQKRSELIGATRMGSYLHWIKNYVTYPDLNSEGAEEIIDDRNSEGGQRQFEEGLLFIFNDDDRAYKDTRNKMEEIIPFMTHSVTGIYETQCPGCKAIAGEAKDKEGDDIPVTEMAKQSGFTPIDPITNFFDHTRMMIANLGADQQTEEVNIF